MSSLNQSHSSHGILLLDKPSGISSNQALCLAKRFLGIKKAGHTGSLDPLASGMLPLCFGEATKFARFLLEADKCYRVVAKLGEQTKTGDSEGEVIQTRPVPVLTDTYIESMIADFRGEIDQIPSMYSALKYKGQPLYKLARAGQEVERPSRRINIFKLELESFEQSEEQSTLSLVVECSKGTYIRTLVEDLGKAMGCGAHVIALRREWVGSFKDNPMIALNAVEEAGLEARQYILPIETALATYPEIILPEAMAFYLRNGQAVRVGQRSEGWISLKNHLGEFMGVGEYLEDGRVAPRRLLQVATT
ncbi:MAG: tRNA pseudouridine(55) synthase TruB [Candidatus Berkiella sp.]